MLSLSRLREISDIAKRQVDFLNSQQQSREKEVESLRTQLLDFQVHMVLALLFSLLLANLT
jgi:centrosomal protein CEP290